MKSADLDLRELLEFDAAKGGPIHFAGERVLLFAAVALGLLRRALIDTLGVAGARAMLGRFGYAHGWRTAETQKQLPWQTEDDWRRAGGRLHTLQGQVTVEPLPPTTKPNAPSAARPPRGSSASSPSWRSIARTARTRHCGRWPIRSRRASRSCAPAVTPAPPTPARTPTRRSASSPAAPR